MSDFPTVIADGKTGEPIEVNPDMPHDILTWYLIALVQLMGKEAAGRYLGIPQ